MHPMKNRLSTFGLLATLLMAGAAQGQLSSQQPSGTLLLTKQQALEAASANLDVARARSALAGAQADTVSANRSPFPTLSASMGQLDMQNGIGGGNFLTEKTVDKSVGIDWTWERGNKRALRTQAARQNAQAAQWDLNETRTQQVLAALQSFYDLLAYQERLGHLRAIVRSASELSTSAAARVKAGDLSTQEALRTEIEHQRAQSDLLGAELDRQRAALALWQVTGLPNPAEQLQAQADWPLSTDVHFSVELQKLVEARPDVQADAARVLAAQAALDNAQAQKVSDITWGSSYDHYPGTSTALISLRMQMPLQWGYQYQGEIARAIAQLEQARETLERTRRQALSELQRLQQETLNSASRAKAYVDNILPRAQKVAEGAELAYVKGATSLTDVLDARRTLRATLLETLAARTDHAKALGLWQLRVAATQATAPKE
jgi:cobalt-zinc-cadmium efflux system outer membrane protein